jgi:cell division protein FtsB
MQDALITLFSQPIVIGLCIGLSIALLLWIRGCLKARAIKLDRAAQLDRANDEIDHLRKHLHTQMEISTKGNESLKQELEALNTTNQNLKDTISALKDKPGRDVIRTLHLYSKALSMMNTRAPGFGSAWETALKDAEAEVKKEESGIIGWIKKPFLLNKSTSIEAIEDSKG